MANGYANYRQDWVNLIRQTAPRYGVDPQAALAVASREGLGGGVGDGGHAFGPFQLNDAGGTITGRPGNHRAFAESPTGIMWALQQIGQVAHGLRGPQAVNAIVSRFERPANPQAEIQGALGALTQFGGGAATSPPARVRAPSSATPLVNAAAAPDPRQILARALLQATQTGNYLPAFQTIRDLRAQQAQVQQAPAAPAQASAGPGPAARVQPVPPLRGATLPDYPLGRQGKLIGVPYQGSHTLFGNWESDNAVDLAVPTGTPVYAVTSGTIGSQIGALNSGDPHLQGLRLHLDGAGNQFYYAHLGRIVVKPGEQVKAGQLLGYSGSANGVNHLHFAARRGNPVSLLGARG